MAKEYLPARCAPGAVTVVHVGNGRAQQLLASHSDAAAQTVSFYDGTDATGTLIKQVIVNPSQDPHMPTAFDPPVPFTFGLAVDPGNCEVAVWAIGGN